MHGAPCRLSIDGVFSMLFYAAGGLGRRRFDVQEIQKTSWRNWQVDTLQMHMYA